MIDAVEEGFDVGVNYPSIALTHIRLQFVDGLVGRSLRAESVVVGAEVRFPLRLDDLRDGLLDV